MNWESDSETLNGTAVIKYPRLSPSEPADTAVTYPVKLSITNPAGTAEIVYADVVVKEPAATAKTVLFLDAPTHTQLLFNPADSAETNLFPHEQSGENASVKYAVKYVSKHNPRIYMNKRRAVKNRSQKIYVSEGVQSDYLPILTIVTLLTLLMIMVRLWQIWVERWLGSMSLALGPFLSFHS